MAEAGADRRAPRSARRVVRAAAGASTAGVRSSRQAEHLAFARARARRTSTPRSPGARPTTRCSRCASPTGSAGRGSCSATAAAPQRLLAALAAAGEAAPASERATAYLLAAWIEASTGHLELAREHVADRRRAAPATPTCGRAATTTSPTSSRTTASGSTRWSSPPAAPAGLEHAWDQAANALFAARAAISAGDRERAAVARDEVERWLRDRRRPVAARPPRRDARRAGAGRASLRRRRAPHRPGGRDLGPARLPADRGLPAHQPRASAVPGRRLRDRRGHAGARDREGRGDRGRAARRARPRASRARPAGARAGPRAARAALEAAAAWHRARRRRRAGGARRVPAGRARRARRRAGRLARLARSSTVARRDGDAPVEVFALDALGRSGSDGRPADARLARVALHHRARSGRRARWLQHRRTPAGRP